MWLKTVDGNYYNTNTNVSVGVVEARVGGEFRVCVLNAQSNTAIVCVQNGYRSREDAEEALGNVFAGEEVVELDVPDYSEEDSDVDDESDEDDLVSYEDMSVDDLRAECAGREPALPTGGKKSDLVARLREDDAAREGARSTVV